MFDLSQAAPDPTYPDLTALPDSADFQPNALRVVMASSTVTYLVVGGVNTTYPPNPGLIVYGSVAAGSTKLNFIGSTVLPSFQSGVTALSQTSTHSVLASTDQGVFKCAALTPGTPMYRSVRKLATALTAAAVAT